MTRAADSLTFSVRPTVVAHYLGQLSLLLALVLVVPGAVAAFTDPREVALRYLAVIAALAAAGLAARRLERGDRLQRNEALAVAALGFLGASLAAGAAFTAYGLGFADAWFEATSGVTTTGLTVLANVPEASPSLLFARAWLQWVGGLGVLALALAFTIPAGLPAKRLALDKRSIEDIAGGTRTYARMLITVYGSLSLAALALLLASGLPWWDALLHMLSGVSTGGYSNHETSIAAFPAWYQQAAVLLVSLAGAVPFIVYFRLGERRFLAACGDPELKWLLILGGVLGAAILALESLRHGFSPALLEDALLLGYSAQSTTGYSPLAVTGLTPASQAFIVGAMLIGGGLGSTAGGFKLRRWLIIWEVFRLSLERLHSPPRSVLKARLGGDALADEELLSACLVILAFMITLFVSWCCLAALGHPPLPALFDAASALGTVGLSAGVVSASLDLPSKLVLTLGMLLGRLEIVAIVVLLLPRTWFGRRRRIK